ncbi:MULTISPECIES: hypothetical protein [Prochlorococcus]|uniref:hypothetical protein n=1 Tax=Prochlorococcus TaxID=1218 RepID=UPI001F4CC14C|nr:MULTISPECIES: hypothetical protein [Prochlorococcus]
MTFLAVFVISSILFSGLTKVEALSSEANGDNPLKIVIEQTGDQQNNEKSLDQRKMERVPDLGDDQVFPFVAGLDSYEVMR